MAKSLTTNTIGRLHYIFSNLKWHISRQNSHGKASFDEFCKMLELLEVAEQNLVLLLIERFLWCGIEDYSFHIKVALTQLDTAHFGAGNEVFIIPITNPNELHLSKSGGLVSYLIKASADQYSVFQNKKITALSGVASLGMPAYKNRSNATIIFVDDYIGTGETAITVLDEYEQNEKKADDSVIAVCLVSLRTGFEELQGRIKSVFASIIRNKGISDSPIINDKTTAFAIMRAIEERLNVASKYRLGYMGSEGLESMIRTPDNTFPIFWHCGNYGNQPWPTPFPR